MTNTIPADQLVIATSSYCGYPKMEIPQVGLAFPHAQYTSNQTSAIFTEQIKNIAFKINNVHAKHLA
jgi:hypothetical protein